MQRNRPDPDLCFFVDLFKEDGCPYAKLSVNPLARKIYQFCLYSIDSWEEEDKIDKSVKRKKFSLSIEKFSFSCDLFNVKREDRMEAMEWVNVAVEAANEAPELFIREERRKRWGIV